MLNPEPGRLSIFVTNVSSTEQLASSFAEKGSGADVGNLSMSLASQDIKGILLLASSKSKATNKSPNNSSLRLCLSEPCLGWKLKPAS